MSLSSSDAAIIMGMLSRGDNNHDIAAWFGENPGRVAEVKDGTMFGIVPSASPAQLPPSGAPGPKGRRMRAYVEDAIAALAKSPPDIALAQKELRDGAAIWDANS